MQGRPVGTIFAELDLDYSKLTKKQKSIINDANNTALDVEKSWRIIGKQSDAMYDQMRKQINNAYNQIKNKAGVTADEIVRAEKAAKAKIKRIDEQQYGRQTSMLSKMKKNWLAYTAAITASYLVVSRTIDNIIEKVQYADKIAKTADVIGVTTDALQEYRYAADLSGVSTEYLDKGLQKFVRNLGDAKNGTGTLTTFLRKFDEELFNNITTTKSVDEGLNMMFDALSKTNDMTERNALAAAAFGRSGQQMIVMIKNGYEALEKMRKEAREMGLVLEEDLLRNAEIANDRFTTLSYVLKARVTEAIITLAPQIQKLTENIIDLATVISRLYETERSSTYGIAEQIDYLSDSLDKASKRLEYLRDQQEKTWFGKDSYNDKIAAQAEEVDRLTKVLERLRDVQSNINNEQLLSYNSNLSSKLGLSEEYRMSLEDIPGIMNIPDLDKIDSELEKFFDSVYEMYEKDKEEKLKIQSDFIEKYEEMNKSKFDMERDAINRQGELWKQAGADRIKVEEYTQKKLSEINKAEQRARMSDIQATTGMMADNFKQISEMGAKHSKEAFALYKAFKITETIISTYSGAMKAYEAMASIPYVGPVLGAAAAGATVAFGLAQIAAIKNAQPPSYDSGGISNAGGLYRTGNIREAHVPIPSGKIPVELKDGGGPTIEIHNHIEGNTFYDKEKMSQVMSQIADGAVYRNFESAYKRSYVNDKVTRQLTRGRP